MSMAAHGYGRQAKGPLALVCSMALLLCQAPGTRADELHYVVRPDDSLWTISSRYLDRMSLVPALQRLNQVQEPRRLMPGRVIRLPVAWLKRVALEARLVDLRGVVEWLPRGAGAGQPATPDLLLVNGDGLRTGPNSNAVLELAGSGRVLLNADSLVRIQSLNRLGASEALETRLRIERGSTENLVNPFRDPASRFEIHTPSAIAAARGTNYRVGVLDNRATRTEVLHGDVDVAAAGQSVSLSPGFGTLVEAGDAPGQGRPLPTPPDLSGLPREYTTLPLRIALPPTPGAAAWRTQIAAAARPDHLLHEQFESRPRAQVDDLPDGEYRLRVRVRDEAGLEGLDAEGRFVLNARPFPPFLLEPQPGAELTAPTAFRWSAQRPPMHYRLQLATDAGFSEPFLDREGIPQPDLGMPADLKPGIYHWRVAAVDTAEGKGPFGDPASFRILPPPPRPPETQPPELGEKTLNLRWKSGEPGDRYEIQIARDVEFTRPVHQEVLAVTQLQLPKPEPGVYHVRARTLGPDGRAGPYSVPQQITLPEETRHPWWLLLLLLPLAL